MHLLLFQRSVHPGSVQASCLAHGDTVKWARFLPGIWLHPVGWRASVLVASLSGPGFELQGIVFSAGLILSGHKALKILYLRKINPFPSSEVYGLLERWAKMEPGSCLQMAVVSTPPSFQVLMALVTQFPQALPCTPTSSRA